MYALVWCTCTFMHTCFVVGMHMCAYLCVHESLLMCVHILSPTKTPESKNTSSSISTPLSPVFL